MVSAYSKLMPYQSSHLRISIGWLGDEEPLEERVELSDKVNQVRSRLSSAPSSLPNIHLAWRGFSPFSSTSWHNHLNVQVDPINAIQVPPSCNLVVPGRFCKAARGFQFGVSSQWCNNCCHMAVASHWAFCLKPLLLTTWHPPTP